jgi:non-heme chloroperoxidase
MKKLILISFFLGFTAFVQLSSAQDQYFETSDGVRIHYLESGEGETLIFITGWKMPAEIWKYQLDYFSRNYHVIALDPRSQGRSELVIQDNTLERRTKDIIELIEHLEVEPYSIIGWSGGMWETLALLDQSTSMNIKSVVLVDYIMDRKVDLDLLNNAMTTWKDHQSYPEKTTNSFVRGCFTKEHNESFIKEITDLSLNTPGSIAFAIGANLILFDRDWWPTLEGRDLKILYVVRDRYKNLAEEFKKRLPDAEVEVFMGAGHALFVDESERFNKLLTQFFESIEK